MNQQQKLKIAAIPDITALAVKSSNPLLEAVNDYGTRKAVQGAYKSFGHAVFAGVFIAIAFIFYITVTTGVGDHWGTIKLQGGVAFSLGLILVVVAGGELFTSTMLSSISRYSGRISTYQLIVSWARVYLGNLIGAAFMVWLVIGGKMYQLDHNIWGLNALTVAQHKLQHTWWQAFSLGVLCNLLVCLGVWMTFSAKDTLSKALLLILPIAMFVSSGFEHCVANLFMVPLGIVIQNIAPAEFFASLGISATQYSDLTFSRFLVSNLVPVTLGNIVGGAVIVGFGYWAIDRPKPVIISSAPSMNTTHAQIERHAPVILKKDSKMKDALINKTVRDIMATTYTALHSSASIAEALTHLAAEHSALAMVVDDKNCLLGVVSEQDLLRHLCVVDFELESRLKVQDAMSVEVITTNPNDSAISLIEYMSVDQEKLYPVSGSGILMDMVNLSFESRLKNAAADKPRVYPVIESGQLIGIVQRRDIISMLASIVSERKEIPTMQPTKETAEA